MVPWRQTFCALHPSLFQPLVDRSYVEGPLRPAVAYNCEAVGAKQNADIINSRWINSNSIELGGH